MPSPIWSHNCGVYEGWNYLLGLYLYSSVVIGIRTSQVKYIISVESMCKYAHTESERERDHKRNVVCSQASFPLLVHYKILGNAKPVMLS